MAVEQQDPRIADLALGRSPRLAARLPSDSSVARLLARPLWIVAICALVMALRVSREVLVPLFLATLLTLVLSGIVEFLRRWRVPRGLSAVVLLLLVAVAMGAALDRLWEPAQEWVQSAPKVLRVIEHRIRPARAVMLRLNDLAARASALAGGNVEQRPAPAITSTTPVTAVSVLTETGGVMGSVITVAVLTLFLLSAGPPTLARMTAALGGNWHAVKVLRIIEAIRVQVGRYYGTLALINLSLGCATAGVMWLLGMPNPILWGALAAVLNFVPYLGSAVTLLVVSLVALVTFDSIAHVLLVAGSFLALATLEGQIVEPICFGRRLQLNPIVVFIALWVGGGLWGIAGVVFALPALLAAKVAASQAGAERALLVRVLGPADGTLEQEEAESRLQIPTMLRARSRWR